MMEENNASNVSVVYLCDDIFDFSTISAAFFILIFILSVIGNGLLLCMLVIYENLKNVTNLFVLNVACSDLAFTLSLPFWAVYYMHDWVFGDFGCKFVTAAHDVGLYSSIILLTFMTVDRFVTVVLTGWPNQVLRHRFAVGSCAAAWVISFAASVSNANHVTVETDLYNSSFCEDYSDFTLGNYLQASLLFFLPFAIIVFCYSAILRKVLQSSMTIRHRTTVVVVLCIVTAFFICWGPYNMLILTSTFYEPQKCDAQELFLIAFFICRIIAYSHCCMNPLLYMLSQKLRRHLLHFILCKNLKERRNSQRRTLPSRTSVLQNISYTGQSSTVGNATKEEK